MAKPTFLLLFFYSQVTYGHITPVVKGGNPKHCLTWGTNHDDPTLISDDICSFKDDESQSATFFSTVTYSDDAVVFMGGPNGTSFDYYITMSEDGAVHLNQELLLKELPYTTSETLHSPIKRFDVDSYSFFSASRDFFTCTHPRTIILPNQTTIHCIVVHTCLCSFFLFIHCFIFS